MKNTSFACFLLSRLRSGEAFLSGKSFSSPSSFFIEKDASIREGSTLRYMSTIELSKPANSMYQRQQKLVAGNITSVKSYTPEQPFPDIDMQGEKETETERKKESKQASTKKKGPALA